MPAGATIIGRVAVKILPDTTNFKREAEAKLNEIEKDLKEVKVQLVPDLDETKVKQQVRALNRKLQGELNDITLRVDLDNESGVRAAIGRLKAELSKLNETSIQVELNEGDIEEKLAFLRARLKEIERLDLRIDPTSVKSLEKALAQVEAELAKRKELKVSVRTDRKSLEDTAKEIRKKLADAAKVKLDLDNQAAARLLRDSQALMTRVQAQANRVQFAPGVDDAKMRETRWRIEQELFKVEDLKAKIGVELDPSAKRRMELDLLQLQARIDHMIASVKPEVDEKSEVRTALRLAALARDRLSTIHVNVDTKGYAKALAGLSGIRIVSELHRENLKLAKSLDVIAPKLLAMALGIAAVSAAGLAGTANILAIAGAFATMSGALIAVPGILGGFAVGLGVTFAALKDFKTVLPDVVAQLGGLQDVISTNFYQRFTSPFRDMITTLLPQFKAGLGSTASAVGGFFGSFATGLKNSLSGSLAGMFANLNKSIQIATGSTGGLANIIAVLGRVGTSFLPRLATYFSGLVKQFSTFLSKAEQDGSLKRWINAGIEALKMLGNIIKNVFGIFAGLVKAATASGNAFGGLNDALATVNKTVNSPAFQKGLIGVFTAAHAAMSQIASVSGPAIKQLFLNIGSLLQNILPMVGNTIGVLVKSVATMLNNPAVSTGIANIFAGISRAMASLGPAISRLGPLIGSLLNFFGQFAGPLGEVVAAFMDFTSIADVLLPALTPLINLLSGALIDVFKQLTPVVRSLAELLAQTLGGIIKAITPTIHAMVPVMVGLAKSFVGLLQAVLPLIPPLVSAIAPIIPVIGKALSALVKALTPVIEALAKGLSQALQQILPSLPSLLDSFVKLAQSMADFFVAISPILPPLITLASLVIQAGLAITGWLMTALAGLNSFLAGAVTTAIKGAVAVFQFLSTTISTVWNAIKTATSTAVNFLVTVIGTAVNAIKTAWNTAWAAVSTFLSTTWNNIKNAVGTAIGAVKTVISSTLSTISGIFSSVWNGISNALSSVWGTIKNTVTTGIDNIWNYIKGLPGKIAGLAGSMLSAGGDLISSLFSGIKSALSGIGSFAADIGSAIVNAIIDGLNSILPHHLDISMPGPIPDIHVPLIPEIPHMAMGGTVLPQAGGTLVKLAEAGKAETVVDTGKMNRLIDLALARNAGSGGSQSSKTLIYHAAPGSSIGSEEDLFEASERARFLL